MGGQNAATNISGLKQTFKAIIGINEPPIKVAFSFAVGTFIGFTPFLGFQIMIAIALSWIFRLTKFPVITAVFVTNPLTIVPIYSFNLWVGLKVTHSSLAFSDVDFANVTWESFFGELGNMLWPFLVGCSLVGLAAAVIGFFIVLYAFKMKNRFT